MNLKTFFTLLAMMTLFTPSLSTQAARAAHKAAVKNKPSSKPAKGKVVRVDPQDPHRKIVYQENQSIDFEGLSLEGELKTPGEFYFQNRNQERFDSLTKRRLNFHREMLRDSVQSQ